MMSDKRLQEMRAEIAKEDSDAPILRHKSWFVNALRDAVAEIEELKAKLAKLAVLLLALAVTACGQPPLDVDLSGVPEEHRAEVTARFDRVVETGLSWWGAERSDLDGWRVEFVESFENSSYMGLTWYGPKLIQLRLPPDYASDPNVCGELLLLYLPHEIGHAVGNHSHSGARWAREFEVLRAMVGENPACDDRGAL